MDSMDLLTPERLEERGALLDSAELIIADANIPETSIEWLAARYPRGSKRPLLGFDPVSARKASRGATSLASFDFAKPNRAEAAILLGLGQDSAEPSSATPAELARALRARGLGAAFISLGPEGMLAEGPGLDGSAESWIATLPPRPQPGLNRVNTSGAGDAACAAIAWSLLSDAEPGKRGGLGERCALALAAALIAAASESPVNPAMSAALLLETAKGIHRERVS
jgi:pseudouridine kinase